MPKYSQRTQPNTELFTSARETDPVPLDVNPNAANLRIKRSDQKISHRDARAGPVCDGCEDADGSPKSCEDRSPKSKASKLCRVSRRCRGGRCASSKENECLDTGDNSGLVEDGWEAASDALGLHTIEKKFSNVLQPQSAVSNDHRQRPRASNASLLGPKPSSQQQNASHGRAWMQGDLHRPTSLPNPMKQRNSGTQLSSIRHTNDGTERLECLICTEVLDSTDASFDSCECGFNICLFCYHKISQETGRCPGCRGIYKQDVSAKPVCLLPR
ncbi:hypothetical protein KP509_39G019900 [Ceratopteris richardii]|nr:hypothetical protein KP509_39G019900 [Ceratopteris richardii]